MDAVVEISIHRPFAVAATRAANVYIDAGVSSVRALACDEAGKELAHVEIPSNENLAGAIAQHKLDQLPESCGVYLTGKLYEVVRGHIGRGEAILSPAAMWAAARELSSGEPLGILELSASGYMAVGIDGEGNLKDDMLVTNPRCGAGSGVNLDRVLQKLNLAREEVDDLLVGYIGEENRQRRDEVNIRADRCGVFASSATISDKNQGIPLDFALAVTLKSEVLKACKKLHSGFPTVWLSGGIFRWRYARDCAADYLRSIGCTEVRFDEGGRLPLTGLQYLQRTIGAGNFSQPDRRVVPFPRPDEYPAMREVHAQLEKNHLYQRIPNDAPTEFDAEQLMAQPVMMGLDVGSTMAKLIMADVSGEQILYKGSYSNAGDTIDTIKKIFADIASKGVENLKISRIGITGSARYQVQKALLNIYPQMADRVSVLVENYAHAYGSIDYAREHIERLKAAGVEDINEEFCLLVDIGGEDTKISSISLKRTELFDNAMNVKCSAGTGSLLDTLTSMFFLKDIGAAGELAFNAEKGYAINATCAVFLMENARKLQAEGYGIDEILASANWAIVENMARTLWNQIELPRHTVTLLHGQTMLSEPLPVAVAQRLQSYVGDDIYCLVPPDPGHRACIGLIHSLAKMETGSSVELSLEEFQQKQYNKKIVVCKGAVCGDPDARCNRSHLAATGHEGKKFSFTLGGCTAINEVQAKKGSRSKSTPDTYKQIWSFINDRLPHSDDPTRLVIPRSFAVSEWALFFAELFTPLGIPVNVDNVRESDVIDAQPHFHIDTCAPHVGVVGQFLRLASQPHGMILAPQIETMPVKHSLGRTCTINLGGLAVAQKIAEVEHPDSRIHLFYLDLKVQDANHIAQRIYSRLQPVYAHYGKEIEFPRFVEIVAQALEAQRVLKREAGDLAAELATQALDEGREVALVVGREYILNPGIYDSHVGRLVRDKNMAAIPSYLLDVEANPEFKHLYWRNPHIIATLADASARRELRKVVNHEGIRRVFERVETQSDALTPIIQVSTFLCGPDSVTTPLVAELTRKRPYLLIQSDAVIKELAHLENRMNTYVKQLELGLHEELMQSTEDEGFEVKMLDRLVSQDPLNAETDVIYFPTLSDNRVLTSVFRSAGFSCIDNYSEEYDLQSAIKMGRAMSGDSVCAPLAAVYGDVEAIVEDFKRRRAQNDPQVAGKSRLLIFNNKGAGPCRQGQYVETHKIYFNKRQSAQQKETGKGPEEELIMQFLVGNENKGYNVGVPGWVFVRAMQGVVLQGVLHELLAKGGTQCRDFDEYQAFIHDYRKLKEKLYTILEKRMAPSAAALAVADKFQRLPGLNYLVNYFAYGLSRKDLQGPITAFAKQWCSRPIQGDATRIHLDGEAYMRVAQYEDVFRTLLATMGFRKFKLTHNPVWGYMDYKLAGMVMRAQEAIDESSQQLKRDVPVEERKRLKRYRRSKQARLLGLKAAYFILRRIIAAPLYRAASLDMPDPVSKVLDIGEQVITTKRPGGELVPYIGEAVMKLRKGYDLVLNVAPEGCCVSSMGEAITPGIYNAVPDAHGKVQHLFSQQGDVDDELIALALLKTIGPERYYRSAEAVA